MQKCNAENAMQKCNAEMQCRNAMQKKIKNTQINEKQCQMNEKDINEETDKSTRKSGSDQK